MEAFHQTPLIRLNDLLPVQCGLDIEIDSGVKNGTIATDPASRQ